MDWAPFLWPVLATLVGLALFHPRSPISRTRWARRAAATTRRRPGKPSFAAVMVSGAAEEKRSRLRRLRLQGLVLWTVMSLVSIAIREYGYAAFFIAIDAVTYAYCRTQLRRLG